MIIETVCRCIEVIIWPLALPVGIIRRLTGRQ